MTSYNDPFFVETMVMLESCFYSVELKSKAKYVKLEYNVTFLLHYYSINLFAKKRLRPETQHVLTIRVGPLILSVTCQPGNTFPSNILFYLKVRYNRLTLPTVSR